MPSAAPVSSADSPTATRSMQQLALVRRQEVEQPARSVRLAAAYGIVLRAEAGSQRVSGRSSVGTAARTAARWASTTLCAAMPKTNASNGRPSSR